MEHSPKTMGTMGVGKGLEETAWRGNHGPETLGDIHACSPAESPGSEPTGESVSLC